LPLFVSEGKAQAPRFGETTTAQGRVQSFTAAPMGELDGAVLDDGTVIHWPPHLAARFSAIASKGESIRVAGRMETGPAGDTHLEVQTVTNLRTNASAENDGLQPSDRIGSGNSGGFASSTERGGDVERRLKALEEQITQLRAEIRRLSR
jgi:hypothetical protein